MTIGIVFENYLRPGKGSPEGTGSSFGGWWGVGSVGWSVGPTAGTATRRGANRFGSYRCQGYAPTTGRVGLIAIIVTAKPTPGTATPGPLSVTPCV